MRESIVMLLNRAKTANNFLFGFVFQSKGSLNRLFPFSGCLTLYRF